MRRFNKKSALIAVAGVVFAFSASGAAYAYWTATSTGSATGTAGTAVGVVITGTVVGSPYPGGNNVVTFTAANANTSPVKIGTVSDTAIDSNADACDALIADFSFADVVEDYLVPAGATAQALPVNGSLVYAYSPSVNQDACKNAVITLTLTATAAA